MRDTVTTNVYVYSVQDLSTSYAMSMVVCLQLFEECYSALGSPLYTFAVCCMFVRPSGLVLLINLVQWRIVLL